jgi:ferredoxin
MRILSKAINKQLPEETFGKCGGNCDCGTCHVYLPNQDGLPEKEVEERGCLGKLPNMSPERSRLSCCLEAMPYLQGKTFEKSIDR